MILISGSSHRDLSQSIALRLSVPHIQAQIKRFEDQELRVQIHEKMYEQDAVIIQSTSKPANDHFMELLLLVDTLKRAGANRIIAVIPYFGYGRQDRPSYRHGPISASLVATLLEAAGVDRVLTLDLHSRQTEGFFKIGVQNLSSVPIFAPLFLDTQDAVVVSPDIGGVTRAQELSQLLRSDLAIINKSRSPSGEAKVSDVIGNVTGKNCILVDDIIDTGGTLCKSAALLKERGARSIVACVSHAVFSGTCIERVEASPIETLYVTNSVPQSRFPKNTQIIPIDQPLAEALGPIKK
jgi:ribose-phosphate pyrophosphokinase